MKTSLFVVFAGLLMASCAKSYIQICDVSSENVPIQDEAFVYSNDACRISYDFWSMNGNPGFMFENLTDSVIYIDLSNSFYVCNGKAYDYYLNRTWPKASSYSSSLMLTRSLVYSTYGEVSGVTYVERNIVAIPAHSYKVIAEYSVLSDILQDCSLKMFPRKKQHEILKFTEENTPIKFRNDIAYVLGSSGTHQIISNKFHISKIANYNLLDTEQYIKEGCKNQKDVVINKFTDRKRFYIKYNGTHSNDYSADSKKKKTIKKGPMTSNKIHNAKYSVRK